MGACKAMILKLNFPHIVFGASASDGKKEVPSAVLESCIKVTRPCGGIGVPGLYVPSDPGAPDSNSGQGMLLISFGKLFEKVCLTCLY